MLLKGKVTPQHAMQGQWKERYTLLILSLGARSRVAGKRQAPVALPLRKSPCTHCAKGWMGPRAALEGCGAKKISCPSKGSNPEPSWWKDVPDLVCTVQTGPCNEKN